MDDPISEKLYTFPLLFLPSKDFFDIPDKHRISMTNFAFNHGTVPSSDLRCYRMFYQFDNHLLIPDFDLMVVIGKYLDYSLFKSPFFKNEDEFLAAKIRSNQWKEKRNENVIQSMLSRFECIDIGRIFEYQMREERDFKISSKREMIKSILEGSNYLPSDLLSYNFFTYGMTDGFEYQGEDAYYGAWDLCILQSRFISE
ncbi:hypothetical protein ND861_09500 [Leptospira sp. 2 VSF19]|uniref:Uncharacterized protein n=1 Tax=Leptospira soteropolitanensis TaxID=2950025 RepID=A0AAW5VFI9_9LEPT|nr:hypothetical protein [Leptospira soteropolitanensis]MCW7492560.1 hypothetical protein [Leptospira soteropolitanensis]MCW7500608.1 hypothetical protein [Leptospira soteropolitanensis]MCW7522722.1 hypothetical protein [Leptospira soteropolitanensis]MCW7526578.1 hypothetical protein [Leptospira soteropolitanensis]MCW7530578.1 hypothetical protein [Leptospira soteropolitanensis]